MIVQCLLGCANNYLKDYLELSSQTPPPRSQGLSPGLGAGAG